MHGAGIGATHRRRGWIVADLMQQAREILAKEFPLSDPRRAALLRGGTVLDLQYGLALRAVVIALRTAPEGFVLVPVQTLESIRDSSTDSSARGFAAGALAALPQGVSDA